MPRSRSINASTTDHLLKRASRSFHTSSVDVIVPARRSQIPLEIVDRIIQLMAPLGGWKRASFARIAPLLLVSHAFHFMALRRFFEDLHLERRLDFQGAFQFLFNQAEPVRCLGLGWVRHLRLSSRVLVHKPPVFPPLSRLHTLEVDCLNETLVTQHSRLKALTDCLSESTDAYHTLTSLTLTNLSRIDVTLLSLIADTLPALVDLSLGCTERIDLDCCWNCYEDSLGCICHSPLPGLYADVEKLAESFGNALSPLTNLANLHLGIFLCDEALVFTHMEHLIEDCSHATTKIDEKSLNCPRCPKEVDDARIRELTASLILGKMLRGLRTVGWSSFYGGFPITKSQLEAILQHENREADACPDLNASIGTDAGKMVDDVIVSVKIAISRHKGEISARRMTG